MRVLLVRSTHGHLSVTHLSQLLHGLRDVLVRSMRSRTWRCFPTAASQARGTLHGGAAMPWSGAFKIKVGFKLLFTDRDVPMSYLLVHRRQLPL